MSDENDWIFDFVLQFLGSDRFDAAVMDFVDENCHVFENDDENKFIYTDIYHEFLDHMEGVINSNLAELDVSPDVFYEACQKSRNIRDINRQVFEKLIAMEDFTVFKKIMVKRNTELQYEAMQSYKEFAGLSLGEGNDNDLSHLPDPEELERILSEKESFSEDVDFDSEKVEAMYRESLLELEMLHKQEELEQLDMEQALALSLMAEEERLRQARIEVKSSPDDEDEDYESSRREKSESKHDSDVRSRGSKHESGGDKESPSEKLESKSSGTSKAKLKPTERSMADQTFADPKPLKMTGLDSPLKALPSISKKKKQDDLVEMNRSYNERKKKAEQTFSKNVQLMTESKLKHGELTKGNAIAEEEARKRSEYMQAQREKLIAAKKKEREAKVNAENDRLGRSSSQLDRQESKQDSDSSSTTRRSRKEEEQEQQRSAMRMALARRMRQGLIESEEAKLCEQYDNQYSALDSKLLEVERLRAENQMRENLLSENLRRQQAAVARNVQRSAAQMRMEENKIR